MKPINYTIRQASPDDAESYREFMLSIANEPNNGVLFHPGEYTATVDEVRDRLTNAHEGVNRMVFVAVDTTNRVIGETSAASRDRLANRHTFGLGITVDAAYRGQGIGKALMQALVDWAQDNPLAHRLELEVFTDNIRAINLYLQMGFEVEGRKRKAYRKHGAFKDTYVMAILFEGKE